MKIYEGVHQLKIDFHVISEIKRYVYVYIITGQYCYLVDSGVAGSEKLIESYLKSIGYHLDDIKVIFLTHSHPDHMGSAGMIQKKTGCQIYASCHEKEWIENIDQQFQERAIPHFFKLLNQSAYVDIAIEKDMFIELEKDITVDILQTPGHSDGSLSFLFNKHILMSGDAIPVVGDIPIYTDVTSSLLSLNKLSQIDNVDYYCPAWDKIYSSKLGQNKIKAAKEMIENIGKCISYIIENEEDIDDCIFIEKVCRYMKMEMFLQNPLFSQTLLSYRKS